MLIDWFTTGAQILNFLILVWLLKRFLYKPVLAAMDAREKQIDDSLRAAADQKGEAEQERAHYLQQSEELERRKAAILHRATEEAESKRQTLQQAAREEIDARRAQWLQALQSDQESWRHALTLQMEQEVFATVRQLLKDMAGDGLEERMVATFIRRLQELEPAEKERMRAALKGSPTPPVVRSAFVLPAATQSELLQALKTELGVTTTPEFQVVPDRVGGIELAADGSKISWTIEGYLTSLEKSLQEALQTEQAPETEWMANAHG